MKPRVFVDQMGRRLILQRHPPQRIVSLVPSQTELLYALGLEAEVVGITKFCIHPAAWFQHKNRVGGTKTLHFDKIEALQPDLLLGNREENEREQIEALAERYPVWMSDILCLDDALDMIARVGELTGKAAEAQDLSGKMQAAFAGLGHARRRRAAYLIWRKPYLVAAGETFIHDMLERAGFENVFARQRRYPEISAAELAAARPEVVLLSSEPYPFAEKHMEAIREICPDARVLLADGELFSWYGSRLLQAPDYFRALRQRLDLDGF